MKKYLFLDNYRGFSNVIVPLVDVNFLVGENSSGKTSVLGLLRILSNPSLFMGEVFGSTDGVQFGHFNEVVSAHATDRSYFRVGFDVIHGWGPLPAAIARSCAKRLLPLRAKQALRVVSGADAATYGAAILLRPRA
jgi:AAA ATPase domain